MHESLKQLSLSLINIGYDKFDHEWNFDNVFSPFSRMYFIEDGQAEVYHHDQKFLLEPGYLYLIPSFSYSRYKCDSFLYQYYVSFFEEIGEGFSIYYLKDFQYKVKASQRDINHFKRLLEINPKRELSDYDPETYDNYPMLLKYERLNQLLPTSAFIESQGLMLCLLSRFLLQKERKDKNGHDTPHRLSESIRYILENLHNELSVALVADRFHLNVDYYSRLFKEYLGIRPLEFIQLKRIERAQLLLCTTAHSINEIAFKVGLPNVPYFTRLFKKNTGQSPSLFRKNYWKS